MRLVCPNCEAKYEVPDDAIPDTGRDVQCASCNHAWFQMRARAPIAPPIKVAPIDADKPIDRGTKPQAPLPETSSDLPPPDVTIQGEAEAAPAVGGDDGAATPARAQDEKVLTILREEAEREARARREKTRPLGYQGDLGVESAVEPRKKAAAKKKDAAELPAEPAPQTVVSTEPQDQPIAPVPSATPEFVREIVREPEAEAEIELKIAARRDLLPDVEEIKSTLEPTEGEESEFASGANSEGYGSARGGAFRSGFLTVITVAILAASLYITAPWLAAKIPALSDTLASYVAMVDDVRLSLDRLMQSATMLIAGDSS